MRIDSAGTTTFTSAATTAPAIFKISTTEVARIDSAGRWLVGTGSALTGYGYTPQQQVAGTTAGTAATLIHGTATPVYPTFSRINAGSTAVANNDAIFDLRAYGYDGSAQGQAARIVAAVDGTPGAGSMPGRLAFSTSPSGSVTPTERLRIDSAGTTTLTSAATTAPFIVNISASEVARIDASGRLLLGAAVSYGAGGLVSQLQINGTTSSTSAFSLTRNSNDTGGAFIVLAKTRGLVSGGATIVADGDDIGDFRFAVADGVDRNSIAAVIRAEVDGTPGAGSSPGRILLSTTPSGSSASTERVRIDSAGTTTFTSAAATAPAIFKINTTEVGRFDSAGRLLVGTSAARGVASATASDFEVETSGLGISVVRNTNDAIPGILSLAKSRGTTAGAVTAVTEGDQLGEIRFAGADGTTISSNGAYIRGVVDGAVGTTDMPCRLVFGTSPDGTATPSERLRITNDGIVAYNQPAEAAVNATATLTIANLKTGIITSTSAAATDMTLPTGTLTEAGFSGVYTNMTFEWSVINTGPSLVRVLAGASHTITGSGSVAAGTSGRFATRRTAANTFVTYRLS
jgi:ABC-type transporter Mla MlaB component